MLVPQDHEAPCDPANKQHHLYNRYSFLVYISPSPSMMKGLFRGLRCIFDADNEKEPEIQIGNPTDVKHVAHIGCDGPSTPAPSWMNEYQGGSDAQSGGTGSKGGSAGGPSPSRPAKAKQSRRQAANSSPEMESPNPNPKPRKNKINNGDSSASANETSSRTRRIKNSILGPESPSQETNARRTRKKKGSTGDGTARSSKTKNKDPTTTDGSGLDSGCSDGVCQKPVD
ncbi:hypothetical protein L6452_09156 [Arctium lappa]|uniref:Uncharacterized protein n=1 Tax=Arctium lappa TaxID=4217 RepID=A0ACB9DJK6_ARCLA|nr:hypothetical protein L6452_09156 [Arctium lappa]